MTPTDDGDLIDALRRIEQLREQLQSQGRLAALGALVAGISHEIKNPLNLIENFTGISDETCQEIVDLLRKHDSQLSPAFKKDFKSLFSKLSFNLKKTEEQCGRASGIVDRMLRHGRSDNGDFELVDVNALVDDYLNLAYNGVRTSEADFRVQIEKNYDDSIRSIRLSPQAVGQALLNVITNGLHAMLKKRAETKNFVARLKIATKDRDDAVEISIRDNGTGIKQEDLPRIFKPFFTTKQGKEGTGLGLSISYDIIVTEHSGDIAVSTKEGKFTEFLISLPKNAVAGTHPQSGTAVFQAGRAGE